MTGAAEIEDARAAVAQLIDLTEREMLDADPAELERPRSRPAAREQQPCEHTQCDAD